jgi:hypothetical protein
MTYSSELTGDLKVDSVVKQIYWILNKLEDEIKKKADKSLLNSIINSLSVNSGVLIPFKYWRFREDGNDLYLEHDDNNGVGVPNWQPYDKYSRT